MIGCGVPLGATGRPKWNVDILDAAFFAFAHQAGGSAVLPRHAELRVRMHMRCSAGIPITP